MYEGETMTKREEELKIRKIYRRKLGELLREGRSLLDSIPLIDHPKNLQEFLKAVQGMNADMKKVIDMTVWKCRVVSCLSILIPMGHPQHMIIVGLQQLNMGDRNGLAAHLSRIATVVECDKQGDYSAWMRLYLSDS